MNTRMNENISTRRYKNIVIAIDLIYSSDDKGYYLERWVMPDNKSASVFYSEITYKTEYAARLDLQSNSVEWIERS